MFDLEPLPARSPVWDTVGAPYRMELGARALEAEERWLELDADLGLDLLTKQELLRDRRDEVFVELAESRPAQREVLSLITRTLLEQYPQYFSSRSGRFRVHATNDEFDLDDPDRPPLELASRCVQEDLVVMQKRGEAWCLSAGCVCFPTRWDLAPMLGRSLNRIHGRVPGYQQELSSASNRFLEALTASKVFRRGNWSVIDDPALFQPLRTISRRPSSEIDASNAGNKLWLRAEHQTLQRLPETGAILFTIRVHRTRLDSVARDEKAAESLIAAVESMPSAMRRYKSIERIRSAAVAYLRGCIDGR